MRIILIAAMAKNRVIGRGSAIPWRLPEEQQRFKAITMGHTLIMGRKTFESIGRPLPGRKTVVITRQKNYQPPGCLVAASLEEALQLCREDDKVFISGGSQIYAQAMPLADEIYLTTLDRDVEGDIYFPPFRQEDFEVSASEAIEGEEPYTFTIFTRKTGANA
ncbi:MAG: dihydrofolate reductase [Desulfobulbaceae bacterium]|nr:dihydrofolate reductase [Desulfobulbaceae bacterium]HIJ77945.1 dihydrofolate reductase [Deltaproteobacteria bacterium]